LYISFQNPELSQLSVMGTQQVFSISSGTIFHYDKTEVREIERERRSIAK
jgi:hypothetical protein